MLLVRSARREQKRQLESRHSPSEGKNEQGEFGLVDQTLYVCVCVWRSLLSRVNISLFAHTDLWLHTFTCWEPNMAAP